MTLTTLPTGFRPIAKAVAKATAAEGSRPILSGLYLRANAGTLTAVAADGFRMAYASTPIDDTSTWDCLISPESFADLFAGRCSIDPESYTTGARKIEGQYVAYEKIIPTVLPYRMTMPAKLIADAHRAFKLPKQKWVDVIECLYLELDADTNTYRACIRRQRDENAIRDDMSAEIYSYPGDALSNPEPVESHIYLNSEYMALVAEFARVGKVTDVTIAWESENLASLATIGTITYIVMPMHIDRDKHIDWQPASWIRLSHPSPATKAPTPKPEPIVVDHEPEPIVCPNADLLRELIAELKIQNTLLRSRVRTA